jgi:hypothetical protein
VITLHAREDGAATRALLDLGFERRGQEYRHATCRLHLAAIEAWSRREGMLKRHAEFVASLA